MIFNSHRILISGYHDNYSPREIFGALKSPGVLPICTVQFHPDEYLGPGGQMTDVPDGSPAQLPARPGELDRVSQSQICRGSRSERSTWQGSLQQGRVATGRKLQG